MNSRSDRLARSSPRRVSRMHDCNAFAPSSWRTSTTVARVPRTHDATAFGDQDLTRSSPWPEQRRFAQTGRPSRGSRTSRAHCVTLTSGAGMFASTNVRTVGRDPVLRTKLPTCPRQHLTAIWRGGGKHRLGAVLRRFPGPSVSGICCCQRPARTAPLGAALLNHKDSPRP